MSCVGFILNDSIKSKLGLDALIFFTKITIQLISHINEVQIHIALKKKPNIILFLGDCRYCQVQSANRYYDTKNDNVYFARNPFVGMRKTSIW